MKKLKEYCKKNKKLIGIVCSIILLIVITVVVKNSLADPNSGYLRNQVVDGLSFENANLEYKSGITTFTVEVYNETESLYQLKTIDIILTDENNQKTTLIGYIGESLEREEGKLIQASIDQDLSNSVSLEYKINK